MVKIETQKARNEQYGMHPVKFSLWLFLVTVVMLFAGFTSALVVSRSDAKLNGTWQEFQIPVWFTISTVIIALSSVSMQWAWIAAKKNEISANRIALWITFLLGSAFLFSQIQGYKALMNAGVFLSGAAKINGRIVTPVSGSFFYLISGIHALHVLGGLVFVAATLLSAYRFRVHSKNMLRISLCTTYWHFIGALWIYLFAILTILR